MTRMNTVIKMKTFYRFIALFALLSLTACGAVVSIDRLSIRFPERSSPAPTVFPSNTPTSTATSTQPPIPTATPTTSLSLKAVTTANVNLRTIPSTANNSPIRVLLAGTQITLIGRLADNTWAKTSSFEGGWVYTQNLSITGNLNSLPIVSLSTPTPTATLDPTPTREVSRVSYNINGESIPDKAYLTGHLQRLCPTTVLVMNNLSYAVELYNLLHSPCGTIVISRNYSALEGSEWLVRSATAFVAQWKAEGHPEIVRYSTNEPSFGGQFSTAQFVASDVELMRVARANGFTVLMGNFSVGIVQAADMQSGVYDAYLQALNQYGHYLALHEYSVVLLPFGVGQWPTSRLLDRTQVQPQSWSIAASLPTAFLSGTCTNNPVYPPYWYLRRGDWWLLRADCLGIARPKIILSEFGWDNLPNIKPDIEPLRLQYGIDRYFRDMRGINTYQRLWAYYFPNWTFSRAACEQLKWASDVYPVEYIGFALFTWSASFDWQQTDYSGRENPAMFGLHRCLEAA